MGARPHVFHARHAWWCVSVCCTRAAAVAVVLCRVTLLRLLVSQPGTESGGKSWVSSWIDMAAAQLLEVVWISSNEIPLSGG